MQHDLSSDPDILIDILIDDPPTPARSIPAIMTEPEIAAFLGLSSARVRTLARDGVLTKAGRGRFDTRASVLAYGERLRAQAGRRDGGGDDYKAERLRLIAAQREGQELKNAQAKAELVPSIDVQREWEALATDLRAALLAIPARVAARSGLSREAAALLESEMRQALEELCQ